MSRTRACGCKGRSRSRTSRWAPAHHPAQRTASGCTGAAGPAAWAGAASCRPGPAASGLSPQSPPHTAAGWERAGSQRVESAWRAWPILANAGQAVAGWLHTSKLTRPLACQRPAHLPFLQQQQAEALHRLRSAGEHGAAPHSRAAAVPLPRRQPSLLGGRARGQHRLELGADADLAVGGVLGQAMNLRGVDQRAAAGRRLDGGWAAAAAGAFSALPSSLDALQSYRG